MQQAVTLCRCAAADTSGGPEAAAPATQMGSWSVHKCDRAGTLLLLHVRPCLSELTQQPDSQQSDPSPSTSLVHRDGHLGCMRALAFRGPVLPTKAPGLRSRGVVTIRSEGLEDSGSIQDIPRRAI